MARIACFYGVAFDRELERKLAQAGHPGRAKIIRLFCRLALKTPDGWTKPLPALLDTGAYLSLIPYSLWASAEVRLLADHEVRGLVPKPECKLDVQVGEVTGVLVDRDHTSGEYSFLSFLARPGDSVPLILGFAELLEKVKLFSDPTSNTAWLEEL